MKEADMWKYFMCLFFHAVIYLTPQVCTSRVLGAAATNEMGFCNTKTVSRLLCYRNFQSSGSGYTKDRQSDYHSKTDKKNYTRGGMRMGRPKSRQAPRTTMSIRVSERERREIEEKAAATGMTPSAYIRTMALDGGNVDMTSHEDRQKLMYELSTIGNNINQIARMANTNVFISKSDVQEVNEQLKQIQRLLLQYIRNR